MPRYLSVDERDYTRVMSALEYVIGRAGNVVDDAMVSYLKEALTETESHVRNENFETVANSTLQDIDLVQRLIGGTFGTPDDNQDT